MTNDFETLLSDYGETVRPFGEDEFIELVNFASDALDQNGGVGEFLVLFRKDRHLRMERLERVSLADLERCEVIIFDDGKSSGNILKHVFFPDRRRRCYVYELG